MPPSEPVTPRVRTDKGAVGVDEPFSYCFDGFGTITSIDRISAVYPDGSAHTNGWARSMPVRQCNEMTFESSEQWSPGTYVLLWRVNGVAAELAINLSTVPTAGPPTGSDPTAVRPAPQSSTPSVALPASNVPLSSLAPRSPQVTTAPVGNYPLCPPVTAFPPALACTFNDAIASYRVGAGVTQADAAAIQKGVSRAHESLAASLNGDSARDVVITISRAGVDPIPDVVGGCCNTSFDGGIRIDFDIANANWTEAAGNFSRYGVAGWHERIAAHEYTHAWQGSRNCQTHSQRSDQVGRPGMNPEWVMEGFADWWAGQTLVTAGVVSGSSLRQWAADEARFYPAVTLRSMEILGGQLHYGISYMAFDRLFAGTGFSPYVTYCTMMGRGAIWTDAFQAAFGVPVANFYADYEQWRTNGFR
jgi:methionine-rich copper-binding protein CopC